MIHEQKSGKKIFTRSLFASTLALSLVTVVPGPAFAQEAVASATCNVKAGKFYTKATGVDYPSGTKIEVVREVDVEDEFRSRQENVVITSASGNWSAPTTEGNLEKAASGSVRTHWLRVKVYNTNGNFIGSSSDSCNMSPGGLDFREPTRAA